MNRRARVGDRIVYGCVFSLSIATACLLLFIVIFLVGESLPVLNRAGSFLVGRNWYPLEGQFGLLPMLVGSIFLALGAVLVAMPFGVVSGIYLAFLGGSSAARCYHVVITALAGMPSVILGLWGLSQIVPLINVWHPPGASLLAGILVLALMIFPTLAIAAKAALSAVPMDVLKGAVALGLPRTAWLLHVALPAAKQGIYTGVALALARAFGETMVVLMVTGNLVQLPSSLFDPVRALTANIALEMAYALDDHRAGLFFSGLLLTLCVWLISAGVSRWVHGRSRRFSGEPNEH